MRQLSFVREETQVSTRPQPLDAMSEGLLHEYGQIRTGQGASVAAVRREISQLRSVARGCGSPETPLTLEEVFDNISSIARFLREPHVPISQATGRARLLAVQRFFRVMGPLLGHEPDVSLATLDALLPARRSTGWHSAGTMVAGERNRRRSRGPTLDVSDLQRIVDAAGDGIGDYRNSRDRALVAMQCYSGLRIEEILRLRWNDLDIGLTAAGYYGATASIERDSRKHLLPLPGPIGEMLDVLRVRAAAHGIDCGERVFHPSGKPGCPLSYRRARKILVEACGRAGLPPVGSAELRAGCAYWLRTQGFSDHEVAMVLGLVRVRSVDRLLSRHQALGAQRRVRERLA